MSAHMHGSRIRFGTFAPTCRGAACQTGAMVDEQEPAKRVVKRVVKKTVVRPTSAAKPVQTAPRVRYGRPGAAPAKPAAKAPSAPQTKVASRPASKQAAPRPSVDVRGKVSASRQRAVDAWWLVADGVTDGTRAAGGFAARRARSVAGWRLPRLNIYVAAAITGAVVGLVAVLLGIAALAIFDAVRGVSSGGGLWGGLAFAGIAIVAGFIGEALLRGFGSTSARLTSFFAIVLVIIAMLGLFLDLADSWVALPLIPLLGIAAFSLAQWLIDIAESTPPEID